VVDIRLTAVPNAPEWWVALPDHEGAGALAQRLSGSATQRVDHPSGRPWLVGTWPTGTLATARAGKAAVAVLGQHDVDGSRLQRRVASARSVAVLDRIADDIPGSVHLVASVDGTTRAQGSVTGVRRVFRVRVGDIECAADRADVLAFLRAAGIDVQRLAAHLLEPPMLSPVAGLPVWEGVAAVPPGDSIELRQDGGVRERTWWTPPRPDRPLADAAAALRHALTTAVSTRVRDRSIVSCDLGGVDSTAVCCLAADVAGRVVAFTAASSDPLADDVAWARRTVQARGDIEHHVIPAADVPLVYHGLHRDRGTLDEPSGAAVDLDRWLLIAERARSRGSDLHFVGFGGDELCYGSLAHVADVLRTRPRAAARHLRGFAAKYRWPRQRVLAQLADRRSYAAWLRGVAGTLAQPAPPPNEPLLTWGFAPRLPPWATSDAVDAVRTLIVDAADRWGPAAPTRGQHRELEAMRFVSRITRQFEQLTLRDGITLAAPYYDDAVVTAGLAARPLERVTPWRYKPLLSAAMRGIVPDGPRQRTSKANGTADEEPGLRRHRAEVLALWDDARIGELGLVDVDALRRVCAGPLPPGLPVGVLYQTLACEVWLRSLERTSVTT
jgi:asparagine synthase (glutamine-hydrolysing)